MSTPQNSDFGTFLRDRSGGQRRRIPLTTLTTPSKSKGRLTKRGQGRQVKATVTSGITTKTPDTVEDLEDFHTPQPTGAPASILEQLPDQTTDNTVTIQPEPVQINQPDINPASVVSEVVTMASPGPQVKINNFSGQPGEKGKAWYERYRNICINMYAYNEAKVKSTFMFYFTGLALAWFNSLTIDIRDDPDAVLDAFINRFDGSDAGFALGSIRQRASEGVSDYYTRFLEITNDQGMPVPWLVATFVDGLAATVRRVVKPQELVTLDAARKSAIRAEQSLSDTVEVSALSPTDTKLNQLFEMMGQLVTKLDNQASVQQQQQQHHPSQQQPGPYPSTWNRRRYNHEQHQNRNKNSNYRQGRDNSYPSGREQNKFCAICLGNTHITDDCHTIEEYRKFHSKQFQKSH